MLHLVMKAGSIIPLPIFPKKHHRFPMKMSECADCFAISVFGGGCLYAAQVTHGSIWTVDERVCFQAKTILEWMLSLLTITPY